LTPVVIAQQKTRETHFEISFSLSSLAAAQTGNAKQT
jgi:hypothetical protein